MGETINRIANELCDFIFCDEESNGEEECGISDPMGDIATQQAELNLEILPVEQESVESTPQFFLVAPTIEEKQTKTDVGSVKNSTTTRLLVRGPSEASGLGEQWNSQPLLERLSLESLLEGRMLRRKLRSMQSKAKRKDNNSRPNGENCVPICGQKHIVGGKSRRDLFQGGVLL